MERNEMAYYNILSDACDALRAELKRNDVRNLEDAQDYIHEVADSHVPVYYNDIFTVMASDGISPEFEDAGLIDGVTDVMSILQARIYEQLTVDLYENLYEELAELLMGHEEEE